MFKSRFAYRSAIVLLLIYLICYGCTLTIILQSSGWSLVAGSVSLLVMLIILVAGVIALDYTYDMYREAVSQGCDDPSTRSPRKGRVDPTIN